MLLRGCTYCVIFVANLKAAVCVGDHLTIAMHNDSCFIFRDDSRALNIVSGI